MLSVSRLINEISFGVVLCLGCLVVAILGLHQLVSETVDHCVVVKWSQIDSYGDMEPGTADDRREFEESTQGTHRSAR